MRQVVADSFWDYTESFESLTDYPYDDVKGLPTIGPGLLLSLGMALSMTWTHTDGSPVSHDDIEAMYAFLTSPAGQATDKQGGTHYAGLTSLRATRAGIIQAGQATLTRFENQLKTFLKNWDAAPANAQLAALSHAWAFGGLFPATWPAWTAAFNAGNWAVCSLQDVPGAAEMAAQNPSFKKRIATEQALLACCYGHDPDTLVGWP